MLLGINCHQASRETLTLAASVGAPVVRCDVNGPDVWPEPERWAWHWLDEFIANATDLGMQVYPTIAYSPAHSGPRPLPPPRDDWIEMVRAFGERYVGKVQMVSIWNEFQGSASQYINELLQPAAETLRDISPEYRICGPDMATTGRWRPWLQTLLSQGQQYLDMLTVHAYASPGRAVLTKLRDVREVMRVTGTLDLDCALTEFGWNSARISEEDQAKYLDQCLEALPSLDWLSAAYYFNLINEPPVEGRHAVNQWGLFRSDGSPKKAAEIFKSYASGEHNA